MKPSGKKLLTVFAHPDDAEIWAGGSLAKWNALGGKSLILCFNVDEKRIREGQMGAKILGSDFKALQSNPLLSEKNINLVRDTVTEYEPDILITHHRDDTHPEHRNIFQLVSNATVNTKINTGKPNMLLCADTYNEILLESTFNPNVYIDISSYFIKKIEAIEQHKSQTFEMWKKIATNQNTLLGSRLPNVTFAEGFIQIPILGTLYNISLF